MNAPTQARDFETEQREKLSSAEDALRAFLELPDDAVLADVVAGFDRIRHPLDEMRGPVGLFSQVHPDESIRDAAKALEQDIAAFETDLSLDRNVYDRLARFAPEDAPGPLERRLLEHAMRDYRRSGVDRDEKTRTRIKELSEELVRIGQEFDLNIAKDTREVRLEGGADDLAGLPADFLDAHPEDDRGAVTVTTDPPEFGPVMSYAENADLRQRLYREYTNRAHPDNLDVLQRLLTKRHELAELLGYVSYADYVTEDKMVQSADKARAFIERISELAREKSEQEYRELLAYKRRSDPQAETVHDWERSYWMEKIKTEKFGFDSQEVRPYFAYPNVRDGVLATSAELYGVEFARNDEVERWHESVECYDVLDAGQRVARFYLDMHPRANKYKHAAMFQVRSGLAEECLPEAVLVCNFTRPTDSDPGLMQHGQVTTFFHEFGHLLHHLFAGRQRYLAFSGIATEWDFVEVPSQMYEEWAWDSAVLGRFARHYESGEPLPAELVERMRAAEEYGKGIQVTQQMFYAMLSLTYYEGDPSDWDLTKRMVEWKERLTQFPYEQGTHFHASFGHLHGYSAIYYTYMWSLVIAKDLFSRFESGLMSRDTAAEYRRTVLAPGGSRDADDLVRDFLGREYAFEAWERWLQR